MPYYSVGDYYGRGDYYQGDGIFSSIGRALKVVGGGIVGAITGAATKGPLGVVPGAITGVVGTVPGVVKQGIMEETLAAGGSQSALTGPSGGAIVAAAARGMPIPGVPVPMALPMIAAPTPGGMLMLAAGGRSPRLPGTNRSTYAVRGGGTSRWGPAGAVRIIPRGTVMVKSRRMNVANPRALRRSLRRAAGFVKLARRAHVKLTQFKGGGKKRKR